MTVKGPPLPKPEIDMDIQIADYDAWDRQFWYAPTGDDVWGAIDYLHSDDEMRVDAIIVALCLAGF